MPNFRSPAGPTKASASGFTLIELMITVAIVALLAAVALPSYTDYIRRGRLVDGTNSLSACRVAMEQYFQDNRTYVGGACNAPTSSDSSSPWLSTTVPRPRPTPSPRPAAAPWTASSTPSTSAA